MLLIRTVIRLRKHPVEASLSHSNVQPSSTLMVSLIAFKNWLAEADFSQCSSSRELRCQYKEQLSQIAQTLLSIDCMSPQTIEPQCKGLVLEVRDRLRELLWGGKTGSDGIAPCDGAEFNIIVDAVCTKKQKDTRAQPSIDPKEPYLWVYNLVLFVPGYAPCYLTYETLDGVLRQARFVLRNTGMLDEGKLVAIIDGARELQYGIERIFRGLEGKQIVLDCWHLRKKLKEHMSMALDGTPEEKRKFVGYICRLIADNQAHVALARLKEIQLITTGNEQELIELVGNEVVAENLINYVKQQKFPAIKRLAPFERVLEYLVSKGQRNMLSGYSLRRKIGLKTSSAPSECANRYTISMRQKGIGASWTKTGIHMSLANLAMLYLNKWDKIWFRYKSINFKLTSADQYEINNSC